MRSGAPIRIPHDLLEPIARTMLDRIACKGFRVLAASIDHEHVHLLVELPDDRQTVKRLVGGWKQAASHAVRERLPGKIWSDGSDPIPIRDRAHQRRVFGYILDHADRGAWVWSFREEPEQDETHHAL